MTGRTIGPAATPFATVLIANRGEIALRVIRTAKAIGLRTVAVHSEADAAARHVRAADTAVLIGEAAPKKSYLDIGRIIDAAKASGADAVHPGYGFLSENAGFAEACAAAGLVFVGPSAEAIRAMGDKAAAKRIMEKAGVPCVPGTSGEDQDEKQLAEAAGRIGFPVMIKAAAGGGGRGMRLVEKPAGFADALRSARSEAENAFGDGRVLLEKAIVEPRHVEIQVFGDRHGNAIHLGERDCSVQRRHQKLIEEAPSPAVSPELRARMGGAAVVAVKAIGYEGAGTLEFLLDRDGGFYFMEMNTRLQVEHPVTEMVTGLDLVELQFRIAAGEPLPLRQEDVRLSGHAIEVRLCAEDPARDFMPQSGTVAFWHPPSGIRVDDTLATGAKIPPFYDSMVGKLVTHSATRDEARRRLIAALEDTAVLGVRTNRAFLARALSHPAFAAGEATTAFVARHGEELLGQDPEADREALAIAAVLLRMAGTGGHALRPHSLAHRFETPMRIEVDGAVHGFALVATQDGFRLAFGDGEVVVGIAAVEEHRISFTIGRSTRSAFFAFDGVDLILQIDGREHRARDLTYLPEIAAGTRRSDGILRATLTGQVTAVHAAPDDAVEPGQVLVTLEAMKMEHAQAARSSGILAEILVSPGDQVAAGQPLARIAADAEREQPR